MVVGRVGQLAIGRSAARGGRGTLQLLDAELLHLVRHVARLGPGAERPALDRVREDRGRPPLVAGGDLIGREDLAIVVAAAAQAAEIVVAQVLDHLEQPRVAPEEVLADVGAGLDRVALPVAVDGVAHGLDQHAVVVLGQQRVPLARPQHLDHVPARAGEQRLQLLDDLAVAAHRTVEPLEIAVDHEDQVVERLAAGRASARRPPRARRSRRRRGTPTPCCSTCRRCRAP